MRILITLFTCVFLAAADEKTKTGLFASELLGSHPLADYKMMRKRLGSPKEQKFVGVEAIEIGRKKQMADFFVPRKARENYGLLVWIPSRHDSRPSKAWREELESLGIIWISPRKAVDKMKTGWHRSALALNAVHHVSRCYPLDTKRIYIGGLSGAGGRALITALFFPDVFKGCIRIASLHPIRGFMFGKVKVQGGLTKFPEESLYNLARKEQTHVIVGGGRDRSSNKAMMESMLKDNFLDNGFKRARSFWLPKLGHQLPDKDTFRSIMIYLEKGEEDE